jgi:hypothetical protein
MGWVEDLHGKTVGLDRTALIFYIEEHVNYGAVLNPFFEAVKQGDIQLVTSTVTLLEVLVHPLRNNDEALAQKYGRQAILKRLTPFTWRLPSTTMPVRF